MTSEKRKCIGEGLISIGNVTSGLSSYRILKLRSTNSPTVGSKEKAVVNQQVREFIIVYLD